MSTPIIRTALLILIYAGIALAIFPYVVGRIHLAVPFLIAGTLLALVSGLLRCCLEGGTCSDRTFHRPTP